MAFHPGIPVRPPATRFLLGLLEPIRRVAVQIVMGPIAALVAGRRIDHTGNVTAGSEHEARVLSDQPLRAIGALPRHYVILARRQQIERYLGLRKVDALATLCGRTRLLDPVLEIGVAGVPAIHRAWQADAVGIPVEQVERV